MQAALEALLGVLLIAWSAQRHLPRLGDPGIDRGLACWALGGLLVALPDINLEGVALSNFDWATSAGAGMIVLALLLARVRAPGAKSSLLQSVLERGVKKGLSPVATKLRAG